jgi:hypothetical protein
MDKFVSLFKHSSFLATILCNLIDCSQITMPFIFKMGKLCDSGSSCFCLLGICRQYLQFCLSLNLLAPGWNHITRGIIQGRSSLYSIRHARVKRLIVQLLSWLYILLASLEASNSCLILSCTPYGPYYSL